uniref:Secreted protein n=1 Tax=Syphacia muris TaxID=451379 RepID=A0A0N5APD2_9BILA
MRACVRACVRTAATNDEITAAAAATAATLVHLVTSSLYRIDKAHKLILLDNVVFKRRPEKTKQQLLLLLLVQHFYAR